MRNLTTSFLLAADDDRALEREALTGAGVRRGLPVVLPTRAALAASGLAFDTLPSADAAAIDAAARASGADVALVGRMLWSDAATSWIADWRLRAADGARAWEGRSLTFDDGFRRALGSAAQILSGNGEPSAPR
jgi:hypothetical protein